MDSKFYFKDFFYVSCALGIAKDQDFPIKYRIDEIAKEYKQVLKLPPHFSILNPIWSNLKRDICSFLLDDGKLEKLSPKDRKLADSLILRSKHQLQEISKVAHGTNHTSQKRNETRNIADHINNGQEIYKDIPASQMSREIKYGHIMWKTKFIYFQTNKRIFAGIHNNWLLIYSNEKDTKPIQAIDLTNYEAKELSNYENTSNTKCLKNISFKVTSRSTDAKIFLFFAQTHKDMLQWVAKINKCRELVEIRPRQFENVVDIRPRHFENVPDKIEYDYEYTNGTRPCSEEEEIYQDIDETVFTMKPALAPPEEPTDEIPPEVPSKSSIGMPARNISTATSNRQDSKQSLLSFTSQCSFSESDSDDPIYEPFIDVRNVQLRNKNWTQIMAIPQISNIVTKQEENINCSPPLPPPPLETRQKVNPQIHNNHVVEEESTPDSPPRLAPKLSIKPKIRDKPKFIPRSSFGK